MMRRKLHLICNAHIDPVWLWEKEEGISAALSTFRMAARFCEKYDGLIFNHNEVVLYEWIEKLEPKLFARIQNLVKEGKWNIMGGWYLQPDCNMPSGESLLRQMDTGRRYFEEKFGVRPTTAINFDPFGHSRGLVQLMVKAGFDSYLFGRPGQWDCPLPENDFAWVGFDGSQIMARRVWPYNTPMGKAAERIRDWLEEEGRQTASPVSCLLWGVGNHGGGPSQKDIEEIGKLMEELAGGSEADWQPVHSTPEAYFAERRIWEGTPGMEIQEVKKDLNAWAVGCYTSQIRIKQKHRKLEGDLALTEKMLSQAAVRGLIDYPEKELKEAERNLLFSEFHDILPGSSIQPVEEQAIRILDHGLSIVETCRQSAFFALQSEQKEAEIGEYPILVYNPHPYSVEMDVECEFLLADQNWSEEVFSVPVVIGDGEEIPCQLEKESCNLNLDWKKKISFHTVLAPASMNRYSVTFRMEDRNRIGDVLKPICGLTEKENEFIFRNENIHAVVSRKSGLLTGYEVNGVEYLTGSGMYLAVMKTDCDPWGMMRHSYREETGRFELMSETAGSRYSGVYNDRYCGKSSMLPSVRVIESGSVRTIIEAVFTYREEPEMSGACGSSQACVQYVFSENSSEVEVRVRVNWAEKGRFLKLEIPTSLHHAKALSETAYGVTEQQADGEEKVFQRWCGFFDEFQDRAITVLNDGTYGADFKNGVIRISMIHSAVYSAHPIKERPLMVQDRFLPYIDQGERSFTFRIQAGGAKVRRELVTREAMVMQEAPMAVQAFPPGEKQDASDLGKKTSVLLDDPAVCLSAWRKINETDQWMMRLYNPTEDVKKVCLKLPIFEIESSLELKPYEVRTMKMCIKDRSLTNCEILGEDIK